MTTEQEKALLMCKRYEPNFDTADTSTRIRAMLYARIACGFVIGSLKYEAKADKKLIKFYEKVEKEIEALPMRPEYTEEQKLEMLYREQQQREEEYFYNQENY